MYNIDEKDKVVEIEGIPQSSIGAPIPFIMSDEYRIILAYYLEETPPDWDGTSVRIVGLSTIDEPIALVQFDRYKAYYFGPPNDEAFAGHPLASRGLGPYGFFEIENSSWIRQLENMNSVHPYHIPDKFYDLKHVIISFHGSIFECVCRDFRLSIKRGSILSLLPEMTELFKTDAV